MHELVSMTTKTRGRKIFRHDVGRLISSRNVANIDTALSDVVARPEVTNIDVFAFSADVVSFLKSNGAGVVTGPAGDRAVDFIAQEPDVWRPFETAGRATESEQCAEGRGGGRQSAQVESGVATGPDWPHEDRTAGPERQQGHDCEVDMEHVSAQAWRKQGLMSLIIFGTGGIIIISML
eukprot:scaffold53198_cov27-Prasinocladus_malaysianus.AAC.2